MLFPQSGNTTRFQDPQRLKLLSKPVTNQDRMSPPSLLHFSSSAIPPPPPLPVLSPLPLVYSAALTPLRHPPCIHVLLTVWFPIELLEVHPPSSKKAPKAPPPTSLLCCPFFGGWVDVTIARVGGPVFRWGSFTFCPPYRQFLPSLALFAFLILLKRAPNAILYLVEGSPPPCFSL